MGFLVTWQTSWLVGLDSRTVCCKFVALSVLGGLRGFEYASISHRYSLALANAFDSNFNHLL